MGRPSMGVKIPGMQLPGAESSSSNSRNKAILNTLNSGSTPQSITQPVNQQISRTPVNNPNTGFTPTPPGASSPSINPNSGAISPGVPITNTPAINSEQTPGFSFNSLQTSTYNPAQILSSLMSANSQMNDMGATYGYY